MIVEKCFCCSDDRWGPGEGKQKCLGESQTMCEGLMDEGAAELTLCLHLSQDMSDELAYL